MFNAYIDKISFCNYVNSKTVFLWGTGLLSKKVISTLNELNINDYSFIDNSKEKQSCSYAGRKVYSPLHLLNQDESKIFIIIACAVEKEIKAIIELLKNGLGA